MTIRLFLAQPTTIFAARVNQASFTYPIAQVAFDTVGTGAYGDIEAGMTVLFGSTAGGDDYGRQRIRKAATSSILYFGRSSEGTRDGEVDLVDNAHITVLNDYRVWSKIPYIDSSGVIYKDHDIAVGTYTTNPPPVANAGAAMAGTVDSGTSLLRVTLPHEANTSFAVSGSISSYAWTLPSGVALVAGYNLTDSQIEVDCDPGFYWVKLVVTDSNAETHTARVPIYARDVSSDTSIGAFTIDSHRITPEGQRLSVRILEDIAESTYPDGTLVMLWEDEPSDGADRSHMLFTGWHQSDPTTIASERTGIVRDTILELLDVAGRLDTLPGFSGSVEVAASPSSWTQMTSPNMDKYLHYLLYWHSTALEVADWSWTGTTTTYPFVVLGNAAESLWDQAMRRARALVPDYILGCNTLGQLQTIVDPMLQATGSRTATIQATLQEADWSSIRYTHERPPRAHWLRGEAIVASNSAISAVFCIVPGETPGQGETANNQGEQLAVSQATLNTCEGHRYARYNAPERYFSIVLSEGADQGIEPADMTWVRLNISASTAAQRGLTLSNERGLVREINIRYDHTRTGLVKQVELLWERETSSTSSAVTVTLPADSLPGAEWDPPDLGYDPVPEPEGYSLYDQFIVGTDVGAAYCDTDTIIVGTVPTWTACGLSSKDVQEIMIKQESNLAYAITTDGLYSTALPFSGSSSWSTVVTFASIYSALGWGSDCQFAGLQASWLDPDKFWMLVHAYNGSKWIPYCAKTANSWSTYTLYRIGSGTGSSFVYGLDLKVVHDDIEETLYAGASYHTFGGRLYKSTDGGATWPTYADIGSFQSFRHIAVTPSDANIVLVGASTGYWYLSEDGLTSWAYSSDQANNVCAGHCRGDGVGVAMPYLVRTKAAGQYREGSSDIQVHTTYSTPMPTWFDAAIGSPEAQDGRCVGWSTNNKFGYFITVGRKNTGPTGADVIHSSDDGTNTLVTGNLQSVLAGSAHGRCIGWEGGAFSE